jgi:hypothetical protein
VRRGNIQLRRADLTSSRPDEPLQVRRSDHWSWLRDVIIPHPSLAGAGLVYAALTLVAEWRARSSVDHHAWGRDESTRHGP